MLYGVIELVGKLLKHTLGVLLLCWQRMLRFGLSVGVLSFVMVEVLGSALTRQFPPGILTTVVALVVSFALGYAAALTALADELFLGAVDTVSILEGDAKAGLRAATAAAEREAGEAERGIMRWLGHSPSSTPTLARSAIPISAPVASRRAISPEAAETLEAIAATEVFQSTAPRPRVNARPVRADQLPRIPWAYEQDGETTAPAPDETPSDAAGPELGSAPDMPPLPLRDAIAAAADETASDVATGDTASDDDDPAATLPAARKPATTAPVASMDSNSASTPASAAVESVEAQDAPSPSPSASSSPDASGNGDRSIWARIGQALVGNTMPLAALGGTHAAPPAGAPRPSATTPEDADKEEPDSRA